MALAEHNPDMGITNNNNNTALHVAAYGGREINTENIRLFLRQVRNRDLHLDETNNRGLTSLEVAYLYNQATFRTLRNTRRWPIHRRLFRVRLVNRRRLDFQLFLRRGGSGRR